MPLPIIASDCGDLRAPRNGMVETTGTKYWDTATYSCIAGYYLVGESERTCEDTGLWSGVAPTCQGKCILRNMAFYSSPFLFLFLLHLLLFLVFFIFSSIPSSSPSSSLSSSLISPPPPPPPSLLLLPIFLLLFLPIFLLLLPIFLIVLLPYFSFSSPSSIPPPPPPYLPPPLSPHLPHCPPPLFLILFLFHILFILIYNSTFFLLRL